MNPSSISILARVCTEAETRALSLWSASLLPLCRTWVAQRRLRPPIDVIETLQKVRFEVPSISETMLKPLMTVPINNGQNESNAEYDSKLEGIATDLSHDLRRYQVLASYAAPHDHKQSFLTDSRDLRRFHRAMLRLQSSRIEIVASEPIMITLFSLERVTLYIPCWLIDAIPHTMFEPNQSFYRARPASLAWLLLDAIVVTPTNEFKMV